MANFVIGFYNRAIASLVTMSGGSWLSTAGLALLLARPVGKVARSTDATIASTVFGVTWATDQTIQAVGLAGHNFSAAATVRIRFVNSVGGTIYDSTALNVWPAGTGATDLLGVSATYTHLATAQFTNVRAIQIDIVDTANAAGYVQAGRLFAGIAWQGAANMDNGAAITFEDPSQFTTALSGAKTSDHRQKFRVATFNTSWMLEAEAMNFAYEIQQLSGMTEEVLFMWDPADTTYKGKRDLLGHFRALNPVHHVFVTTFATSWEIEEYL